MQTNKTTILISCLISLSVSILILVYSYGLLEFPKIGFYSGIGTGIVISTILLLLNLNTWNKKISEHQLKKQKKWFILSLVFLPLVYPLSRLIPLLLNNNQELSSFVGGFFGIFIMSSALMVLYSMKKKVGLFQNTTVEDT